MVAFGVCLGVLFLVMEIRMKYREEKAKKF